MICMLWQWLAERTHPDLARPLWIGRLARRHLDNCPECRRQQALAMVLDRQLRRQASQFPAPDTVNLLRRIRREAWSQAADGSAPRRHPPAYALATACTLLAAAILVGSLLGPTRVQAERNQAGGQPLSPRLALSLHSAAALVELLPWAPTAIPAEDPLTLESQLLASDARRSLIALADCLPFPPATP